MEVPRVRTIESAPVPRKEADSREEMHALWQNLHWQAYTLVFRHLFFDGVHYFLLLHIVYLRATWFHCCSGLN